MNHYQITSRPRHIRYIYFIDEQYSYENLFCLIHENQRIWGGRYNPIIPVLNNVISDRYIELIKHYDPDYVFYSNNVDPEIIKRLRIFNPCGYYNLDAKPREENIRGVNAFNFLSEFDHTSKILTPLNIWENTGGLLKFYKINFGLETNPIFNDDQIGKNYSQIKINKDDVNSLNKKIHLDKPVNKAHLARRNINTSILRSSKSHYDSFELVVARDESSTDDLIYFWNRQLFECKNIVYATLDELNILTEDEYFGGLLYDLSSNYIIPVTSRTLDKKEILDLIEKKLKKKAFNRGFEYIPPEDFPFDIMDSQGHSYMYNFSNPSTTQTLISEKGLIHLSGLSFVDKSEINNLNYIIDIWIYKDDSSISNQLKFPLTTDTRRIIRSSKGRINKGRNISIGINSNIDKSNTLDIEIPQIRHLLSQLICNPIINGGVKDTTFVDIGPHDDSNKLSAFIKAFHFNFQAIEEFFSDKFWVGIFEYLCTNEKVAGEAILFDELKERCIRILKEHKIELGKKEETYLNEENLVLGLKETLAELCDYSVFFIGFNLKCENCSSEFWYHIKEVNEVVICKGCLHDFDLPVEPRFAYKLNDLIKNNIFRSKTQRDGNLTVIRTLLYLNSESRNSFIFSPQINLYNNLHTNKPIGDIDIVGLVNGMLVIGEAKHNSEGFNAKALETLVLISKEILPDKIILSCYQDTNGKLERAKQGLIHRFNKWEYQPEIKTYLVEEPNSFHFRSHRYFYY